MKGPETSKLSYVNNSVRLPLTMLNRFWDWTVQQVSDMTDQLKLTTGTSFFYPEEIIPTDINYQQIDIWQRNFEQTLTKFKRDFKAITQMIKVGDVQPRLPLEEFKTTLIAYRQNIATDKLSLMFFYHNLIELQYYLKALQMIPNNYQIILKELQQELEETLANQSQSSDLILKHCRADIYSGFLKLFKNEIKPKVLRKLMRGYFSYLEATDYNRIMTQVEAIITAKQVWIDEQNQLFFGHDSATFTTYDILQRAMQRLEQAWTTTELPLLISKSMSSVVTYAKKNPIKTILSLSALAVGYYNQPIWNGTEYTFTPTSFTNGITTALPSMIVTYQLNRMSNLPGQHTVGLNTLISVGTSFLQLAQASKQLLEKNGETVPSFVLTLNDRDNIDKFGITKPKFEAAGTLIKQTDNGSYALMGYTSYLDSTSEPDRIRNRLILAEIDPNGQPKWVKPLGNLYWPYSYFVKAPEGGYTVSSSMNAAENSSINAINFDAKGNLNWAKKLTATAVFNTVTRTSIVQYPSSYRISAVINRNIFVADISLNGNLNWAKSLELNIVGVNTIFTERLINGDLLHAGITTNNNIFLINLNEGGDLNWAKEFTYSSNGENYKFSLSNSIIPTISGGFVVSGEMFLSFGDNNGMFLAQFNSLGSLNWMQNVIGDFDVFSAVAQTQDGGYVFTSDSRKLAPENSVGRRVLFIAQFETFGALRWAKILSGVQSIFGYSVTQSIDDGFVITGTSGDDMLLAKFDSEGNVKFDNEKNRVNCNIKEVKPEVERIRLTSTDLSSLTLVEQTNHTVVQNLTNPIDNESVKLEQTELQNNICSSPTNKTLSSTEVALIAGGASVGALGVLGLFAVCYCKKKRKQAQPSKKVSKKTPGQMSNVELEMSKISYLNKQP